jgi:putative thioredoxin
METAVRDVTEATFASGVLDASAERPVVVDFWAAWCGPCRVLGPLLERLADEAKGSWTLAKVDVDANPRLAAQFGVQGIPAVHAFKDGKEVARFVGALPEQQVRAWLAQLGPSAADLALDEAAAAEARGDRQAAIAAYKRALDHEPANARAKAGAARLDLEMRTASLDRDVLAASADADPSDVDTAMGLADLAFADGDVDGAVDRLIRTIISNQGDARDTVRAHLLTLLDTLAADDPRALRARRALANALF